MAELTERDVERWLDTRNATLIGRPFEIRKSEDRKDFIEWFLQAQDEMYDLRERAKHG